MSNRLKRAINERMILLCEKYDDNIKKKGVIKLHQRKLMRF
jgi:hypothetical protein